MHRFGNFCAYASRSFHPLLFFEYFFQERAAMRFDKAVIASRSVIRIRGIKRHVVVPIVAEERRTSITKPERYDPVTAKMNIAARGRQVRIRTRRKRVMRRKTKQPNRFLKHDPLRKSDVCRTFRERGVIGDLSHFFYRVYESERQHARTHIRLSSRRTAVGNNRYCKIVLRKRKRVILAWFCLKHVIAADHKMMVSGKLEHMDLRKKKGRYVRRPRLSIFRSLPRSADSGRPSPVIGTGSTPNAKQNWRSLPGFSRWRRRHQ